MALSFLDHNSRTRFFLNMLFLLKGICPLVLKQKSKYIWVDNNFDKT